MNTLRQFLKGMILLELLVIALFNGVMFLLFSQLDMLEWLVDLSDQHENWELDELIPLSFTLALSFAFFSMRRWRENRALYAEVKKLSIKDPLTGLYNRRYFLKQIGHSLDNLQRYERPFTLFLLDLDHFKQVNDTWGHSVGDEVLRQFANLLRENTRKTDTVARWGGEEFIVLCPDLSCDAIKQMADKLLLHIRGHKYPSAGAITASMGAVCTRSLEENVDALINRADLCLYQSKRLGRDRVVIAE